MIDGNVSQRHLSSATSAEQEAFRQYASEQVSSEILHWRVGSVDDLWGTSPTSRYDALKSYIGTESSQRVIIPEAQIRRILNRMCREAANYPFEDGMTSAFEIKLHELVLSFGIAVLEHLHDIIKDSICSINVAAEILRILGNIGDAQTHPYRKWLMEKYLRHPSYYVRDGAIVGLLHLDDPSSISVVEAVIENESSPVLKKDMLQLVHQLKETQNATSDEDWS